MRPGTKIKIRKDYVEDSLLEKYFDYTMVVSSDPVPTHFITMEFMASLYNKNGYLETIPFRSYEVEVVPLAVGDFVIVNIEATSYYHEYYNKSGPGKIIEATPNEKYVHVKFLHLDSDRVFWPEELDYVLPETVKQTASEEKTEMYSDGSNSSVVDHDFKVGDTVKVVAYGGDDGDHLQGQKGTVVATDYYSDTWPIEVEFESESDTWVFSPNELELVTEETPTVTVDAETEEWEEVWNDLFTDQNVDVVEDATTVPFNETITFTYSVTNGATDAGDGYSKLTTMTISGDLNLDKVYNEFALFLGGAGFVL